MTTPDRNAAQIDYWNGDVGRRWAALQNSLDGLFSKITALAVAAAAPQAGERVLDIGCGSGATLLELSRAVGPSGQVVGYDISEVMLDVARRRIEAAGLTQGRVVLADAATHGFEPGAADLVFSRFGVMFFDAPAEAFANIRGALRPGGRIAFVCWRALAENPFWTVPMVAARPFLAAEDEPPADPYVPGPFAFAEAERLRAILTEAGFSAIDIAPLDAALPLAGPGAFPEAARLVTQIGPVSRALTTIDDAGRVKAEAAIATALGAHDGADGIRLPAALWLVTACA